MLCVVAQQSLSLSLSLFFVATWIKLNSIRLYIKKKERILLQNQIYINRGECPSQAPIKPFWQRDHISFV